MKHLTKEDKIFICIAYACLAVIWMVYTTQSYWRSEDYE